jgi:hypothetical protein
VLNLTRLLPLPEAELGTISCRASRVGGKSQTRTATLTVKPPAPVLQVTPVTNIAASGPPGGPFSPSSFSYTLSATSGSVNYSITTPSWLTASSTSGTVTTSSTNITFTINSSDGNRPRQTPPAAARSDDR